MPLQILCWPISLTSNQCSGKRIIAQVFLPLGGQRCHPFLHAAILSSLISVFQANVKICSCWTSEYWAFWYRLFLPLSGQCCQKIHSFKLQFGVHFKERKKSAHAAHWYSHWVFWQRDCCKGLFTLLSGWSCQEDVKYASHKHVLTSDGNIRMVLIIWKGYEDDGSPGSPWSGICQRRSSSDLTSCPCSVLAWNNIIVFFLRMPLAHLIHFSNSSIMIKGFNNNHLKYNDHWQVCTCFCTSLPEGWPPGGQKFWPASLKF